MKQQVKDYPGQETSSMVKAGKIKSLAWILIILMTSTTAAEGQFFKKKKKEEPKQASPFEKITAAASCDPGFINIYRIENDFYFEIKKSLTLRDLLIVNKISQVPASLNEAGINKGMNYENLVIQFEINKTQKKVYALSYKPFTEVPATDKIAISVGDNFRKSILEAFDIEAWANDSSSVLIKVNSIFNGNKKSLNNVFGMTGLGTSPSTEYSYIGQMKSFPENVVVKSVLTTSIPGAETMARLSVEVTTNMVLLPKQPMTPRFENTRVGYFTTERWYFNDDQHELEKRKLVTRWRLEPKDKAAYLRGELTEPVKPIVFYIDPATPDKWRPFIIQGVFDWQVAFEKAGFKNAIICKDAPLDDPDFDLDDVRYSTIAYAASDKANAMGPSVIDPRSGEIIEADVIWWHNVMTAVQSWMRVQTGIIDPKSRPNRFEDQHMGEAIRFVSSHEIGHTLGLKHNMGASSFYAVDSLRSPAFTGKFATASSIMDYARYNYVAQPGDGVKHITPKIGTYDIFAIDWAYRYYGDENPWNEMKKGNQMVAQAYKNPHNIYLPQQDMRNAVDPRAQSEDLGDNSVKASEYGIENLKRLMTKILDWTTTEGDDYAEAGKLVNAIIGQWHMYSYHVLTNIGGVYLNNTVMGDDQKSYEFVPAQKQKEAVAYLLKHVAACPEWLFSSDVYDLVYPIKLAPDGYREYNPFASFKNAQSYIFWDLLSDERMARMLANEARNGKRAYTAVNMIDDLHNNIFSNTMKGNSLNLYERTTQKAYVDALIIAADRNAASKEKKIQGVGMDQLFDMPKFACSRANCQHEEHRLDSEKIFSGPQRASDAISIKRGELLRIEKLLKIKRTAGDTNTQFHYEDLLLRIEQSLRK